MAAFTKDELLTTITIYWVTERATSAARYYYEGKHLPEPPYVPLESLVEPLTGCTVFLENSVLHCESGPRPV